MPSIYDSVLYLPCDPIQPTMPCSHSLRHSIRFIDRSDRPSMSCYTISLRLSLDIVSLIAIDLKVIAPYLSSSPYIDCLLFSSLSIYLSILLPFVSTIVCLSIASILAPCVRQRLSHPKEYLSFLLRHLQAVSLRVYNCLVSVSARFQ